MVKINHGMAYTKGCVFVVAAMVLLLAAKSHAAPVFGKLFELAQPDGSTVKVRIWGDEFYQVVESLDGYTLVRESQSRRICYAVLSSDGSELVSTGIAAGTDSSGLPANLRIQPHIRINRASVEAKVRTVRKKFTERNKIKLFSATGPAPVQMPAVGNIKGICLIIDFPTEHYTIPAAEVNDFCNKVGYNGYGNQCSVRDYFSDVSDEKLIYTNYVPPVYYTARHPKSYYENPSYDLGIMAAEFVAEALWNLEQEGFDFSQYDSNRDGLIDAVNCYYTGGIRSGWNSGLWPHCSVMDDFSADGVTSFYYQISEMDSALTLYTFCHENGHMVCGWPDLYDRNFDGYRYDSVGVGQYCLMSTYELANETNPVEPCAYLKYLAGWADIVRLDERCSDLELKAGVNQFYWFQNPRYNNELFMISGRLKVNHDTVLPDEGLALWHIDTRGSNDNQQMTADAHYLVSLVQADGRWDLENNINEGDNTDLFDDSEHNRCTPFTDPNTGFWDGFESGVCISDIRMTDDAVFFDFDTAYPIENVTATASGDIDGQEPENTVNGSGMRNELHSTARTAMWLSPDSAPGTAWIRYRFDKPCMLYQMWVWNYNDEFWPRTGAGMKDVVVEYSLDGQEYVAMEETQVFADAPNAANYEHGTVVEFGGVAAQHVRLTALSNWGKANRYGLGEVRFLQAPVRARQPSPQQDAAGVDLDVTLEWVAGTQAAEHNVFFSTSVQDVMDGRSLVAATCDSRYGPLDLERATTYYWRVDEVNDTETPPAWAGEVWNFTTGDYYVVDNFEKYNYSVNIFESNLIYDTWIDGWEDIFNGSIVELESWIVHGGGQSMLFYYDGSYASSSEATVNVDYLAIGRDWTISSPGTLSLWFYGDWWNDSDMQMYVKLNGVKVKYSGDSIALTETFWHRWDIDLAAFGIKLNNVRSLAIGFESPDGFGGYGIVYFDDIRLYHVRQ